jgi:hypothetical protein
MDEELDARFERLLKAGKYTTEFWLALAAQILGALAASGLLSAGHWATQAVGLLVVVLAGMGYSASRTKLKLEALKVLQPLLLEPLEAGGDEEDEDDDDDDDEEEDSPKPEVPDVMPLNLGD